MAAVLLNQGYVEWYCPNCGLTDRTQPLPPDSTRFHNCPSLHSLTAPLIRAGTACKVEAVERADYLGDQVQAVGDDGKTYMAVVTTRDDGTDCIVNAGVARGTMAV